MVTTIGGVFYLRFKHKCLAFREIYKISTAPNLNSCHKFRSFQTVRLNLATFSVTTVATFDIFANSS